MKTTSSLLEDNATSFFHTLEHNDIVLVPGFTTTPFKNFLTRVQNTRFAYISDVDTLDGHHNTINDITSTTLANASITFDAGIHCLAHVEWLNRFEFLLLDGVDDRSLNSDVFLSLLGTLKLKLLPKLIIPLKSHFQLDLYKEWMETEGLYSVGVWNVVDQGSVDLLFAQSTPNTAQLHEQMISTLGDIFQIDSITESYDVLVILPSMVEVSMFSQLLVNSPTRKRDFSIITDTKNYTTKGSHRRVIISTTSQTFLDIEHRVKYIIDCGLIQTSKSDPNGLDHLIHTPTNKNQIHQHASILHLEGSKYFAMCTSTDLSNFEYGIHTTNLIHHALYCAKFPNLRLHHLHFLQSPTTDSLLSTIDTLLQLGLASLTADLQDYTFTPLSLKLAQLHIPPSLPLLSLYIPLLHHHHHTCTTELTRLISTFEVVGIPTLSSYIKHHTLDTRMVVPTSDMLTVLNVVDCCVFGMKIHEDVSGRSTGGVGKDPFSGDVKRWIRRRVMELEQWIGVRSHDKKGKGVDDRDVEEALIFGGQLLFGVVKRVYDSGVATTFVEPVRPFEDTSVTMVLRRDQRDSVAFQDGDLVLIHGYSLEYQGDGKQIAYINLISKVQKHMALGISKLIRSV